MRILWCVEDRFPGWIECELVDAKGREHHLIDKVPLFQHFRLLQVLQSPQIGEAGIQEVICLVGEQFQRESGGVTGMSGFHRRAAGGYRKGGWKWRRNAN